tara:strand:+ start:724 stop:1029 length:306 start_codon:yes stop_codon:yes gene_type:complete
MKTQYNPLTKSYETQDGTSVAAEVCDSNAFRAATIREQQRFEEFPPRLGAMLAIKPHTRTPSVLTDTSEGIAPNRNLFGKPFNPFLTVKPFNPFLTGKETE